MRTQGPTAVSTPPSQAGTTKRRPVRPWTLHQASVVEFEIQARNSGAPAVASPAASARAWQTWLAPAMSSRLPESLQVDRSPVPVAEVTKTWRRAAVSTASSAARPGPATSARVRIASCNFVRVCMGILRGTARSCASARALATDEGEGSRTRFRPMGYHWQA